MMMPRLRTAGKEAVWVLLTALILAAGAYLLRPGILQQQGGAVGLDAGDQENLVSLEAASEYFRQGTAIFADARSDDFYQAGHIQGALNLDPDKFDDWSESVFANIPADATIIVYCDGEHCTLSLELAEKLNWLGYEHVLHMKNGWSLWQESGLPTAKGQDQ